MSSKHVVFIVDGGIGKNIMATVPLRGIKSKYPDRKVIVVCGYPDVFLHNKNADKVFAFHNTQYFYDDYIQGQDTIVLKMEPYLEQEYLQNKKHLTEVWCNVLGVPFDGITPDLHITDLERKNAAGFAKSLSKPLFILQTHGGPPNKRIQHRDIPQETAQKIVNTLKSDYHILHFRHKEQPNIEGTTPAMYRLREVFALLPYAKNTLLIDSFAQHAFAALNHRANVVWGGTSSTVLGYPTHNNIEQVKCDTPGCHRPNSFLFDVINGQEWTCKHGAACLEYEADYILERIEEWKVSHD